MPGSNSSYGGVYRMSAFGGVGSTRISKSQMESRDPRKRFESCAWRRRLRQWKELQSKKQGSFSSRQLMRTVILNTFYIA
ncbi:hypothetical protein Pmar_PMAR027034, partial [Perkinsus marinus ATCC 50983]